MCVLVRKDMHVARQLTILFGSGWVRDRGAQQIDGVINYTRAMTEVTRLLRDIDKGDQNAANALFTIVYNEMRHLGAFHIAEEKSGQSLCTSDLVHEAYLKLIDTDGQLSFQNRRHFFGAAARAMRQVLVDAARRRGRAKRGGDLRRVDLMDIAAEWPDKQLSELQQALDELAAHDPTAAEVVDLHHFAGLPYDKTAELLDVSTYEVRQKWAFARAWLSDQIK